VTQATYLFAELAIMVMTLLIKPRSVPWRLFTSKRFIIMATGLFCIWWIVDLIALALGLWYFPPSGTFRIRLLGLPVEEYGIFLVHTVVCTIFLGLLMDDDL
jgi:lycopene cyclase domain-containing protein